MFDFDFALLDESPRERFHAGQQLMARSEAVMREDASLQSQVICTIPTGGAAEVLLTMGRRMLVSHKGRSEGWVSAEALDGTVLWAERDAKAPAADTSAEVRPFRELDRAWLQLIETQAFGTKEQCLELWLQDARASGARTHVEVAQGDGGRVLGYCAWRLEGALHSPSLHVLGLAVEGRQRRRGTGKALLLRALSFGEAAGAALAMLHVRADNQPAQRLYRRLGFLRVARVLGYYGDSDAWELLRELPAMEKRDVDQKLVCFSCARKAARLANGTSKTCKVHSSGGILITGASSGIGLDATLALAELGFRVYAGVRSEQDAAKVRGSGGSLGPRPVFIDVTREDTVEQARLRIKEELDSEGLEFVALVNCAGVTRRLPIELEEIEAVRQLYEVNVFGVLRVTQAFVDLLRQSEGRIVNIGSIAALLPHKGSSSYSGSKAALDSITDSLRMELSPWNISVSMIQPGYVRTPFAEKQLEATSEAWRRADPATRAKYQDTMSGWAAGRMAHELADGPDLVTQAILDALMNPHPKTRYQVTNVQGYPTWVLALLGWFFPDRVKDSIVAGF
ncbi:unnamed protein product [Effrenium voratum]|nr:unnamed protein product [Effrenium voratum]